MDKSKSVFKVTYTVESNENPTALKAIFESATEGFKTGLRRSIYKAKFISGPTFDVHKPHDPAKDGPKTNKPGEPDALDPVVVIGEAKPHKGEIWSGVAVKETRVDPLTGKALLAGVERSRRFVDKVQKGEIDPATGKPIEVICPGIDDNPRKAFKPPPGCFSKDGKN